MKWVKYHEGMHVPYDPKPNGFHSRVWFRGDDGIVQKGRWRGRNCGIVTIEVAFDSKESRRREPGYLHSSTVEVPESWIVQVEI